MMAVYAFVIIIVLIQSLLSLSVPEPSHYVLSFPTDDNPLNITVSPEKEKNYIMIIGDWGAFRESTPNREVQKRVAKIMKDFYESQKEKGMNLLYVLAAGDNFYWGGVGPQGNEWDFAWREIYGPDLTSSNVKWLAVKGNHDWGDKDNYAMCPWNHTKYIDSTTNIPYACDQCNKDKKGNNPDNYYLPDYSYYYTLNELSLELIVTEESCHYCPGSIGGYDTDDIWNNCKGKGGDTKDGQKIGCQFLCKINNASESMMIARAKVENGNKNVLIMQHYPDEGKRLVDTYKANIKGNVDDYNVWSVYGHAHSQQCNRYYNDTNGHKVCDQIKSGGGGGCCFEDDNLKGIYVIGFDSNGKMIQPYAFNDPKISCEYPCGPALVNDDIDYKQMVMDTCCHTTDAEIDCDAIDLAQCTV